MQQLLEMPLSHCKVEVKLKLIKPFCPQLMEIVLMVMLMIMLMMII